MIRLSLEPDGRTVRIAPRAYLGDLFDPYVRALDGARYDRKLKVSFASIDKVYPILVRLREAGVAVDPPDVGLTRALQKLEKRDWDNLAAARERVARFDAQMRERGESLFPFQRFGAAWLATRTAALLADEMGLGKDQAVSEPVLTPDGWRKMGDLRVGDYVIGRDGKPTVVLGVYPQGVRRQFRVTTNDGASTRCGLEHLWYVETVNSRHRGQRGTVLTLGEILEKGLRTSNGSNRWFIPVPERIEYAERHENVLPLDPYLVGALIANGSLIENHVVHSGTEEQRFEIAQRLPPDHVLHPIAGEPYSVRINRVTKRYNVVRRSIRELGLRGKRSWEKRIPRSYLQSTIGERLSLLAGLLDNDGTISKDGITIEYNTTSEGLSRDVLELVRSLGGVAWVSTRLPHYVYKGERRKGRRDHRVRVALTFDPFRVRSKSDRYHGRSKYPPSRSIESVVEVEAEESVCIRVDAEDHLYVTKDFLVTHNTIQCLAAFPAGAPILVVGPAIAKGAWLADARRFRPQLKVSLLEGRASFRWPAPGEMVVLNYEILPDVHDRKTCDGFLPPEPCKGCRKREIMTLERGIHEIVDGHLKKCDGFLKRRPCPGCHPFLETVPEGMCAAADEAHYLKNSGALRSTRWRAISRAALGKGGRSVLSTGTPMTKDARDLWNVLDVADLAGEAFGTYANLLHLFKAKIVTYGRPGDEEAPKGFQWGTADEVDADEIVVRLRRVSLRRLYPDVMPEMPPLLWRKHPVTLDKKAIASLDRVLGAENVEALLEALAAEKITFEIMSRVGSAVALAKIPAMNDWLDEYEEADTGRPPIVFSAHRAPIEALRKRKGWDVVLGGDTKEPDKRRIVERFQAGELRGIGLTIGAGREAVTLTRANQILFVDLDWTPAHNSQAAKRAHRIGQKTTCINTVLEADHPLDRRITEVLYEKTRLISRTVDASRATEDAPDRSLEEDLKKMRREISEGRAFRRPAEGENERDALQRLSEGAFKDAYHERLAEKLVHEASEVGLSEAQWRLAVEIAGKARERA